MGIYLNPRAVRFSETMASEVFVDKTEMILWMNTIISTKRKYICVSRPRRFGKTIAANMLCAYYGKSEGAELFKKCKISKYEGWDRYLECFDVLRLVMTDFFGRRVGVTEGLADLQQSVLRELKREYPDVNYSRPDDLIRSLRDIYAEKNSRFVIVIDEWDSIFRERPEDKEGQKVYLDFLRDWLKDKEYIALAYMTGILPIKKYGRHSALNMFAEYSMTRPMQMAEYAGFTSAEVDVLCTQFGRNYDVMKEWYDGYLLSNVVPPDPEHKIQKETGEELKPEVYSIYSPLSVVNAVSTGIIGNYWNQTETYEALAEHINKNFGGLKEIVAILMDGGRVKDDVLTLLIHLGYLGYDSDTGEAFIPNKEILDEFKNSTEDDSAWLETFGSFKTSLKLLNAIWSRDEEKMAELLELAHDRAGNKTYNSEAALSYGIKYALYAAEKYYTEIQELDSGKGYADLVYLPSPRYPDKPALLMELKYEKNVQTAADQVRDRNYPQALEHYKDNLLIVSVNYDKEARGEDYKRHSCRIEQA